TFESVNKHLVLVTQDRLLEYMAGEFSFGHLNKPRNIDPMHFHAYELKPTDAGHRLVLRERLSTDTPGIATCLVLKTGAKVDLAVILQLIESKLTTRTIFSLDQPPPPIPVDPEQ